MKNDAYQLFVSAPCIACHICDNDPQNSINCDKFDRWEKEKLPYEHAKLYEKLSIEYYIWLSGG